MKKNPSLNCFSINKWKPILPLLFEDFTHGRSLKLLLSLTDEGILRAAGLSDPEINIIKDLSQEKLQRQKIIKYYVALSLLEQNIISCLKKNDLSRSEKRAIIIENKIKDDEIRE